MRRAGDSRDRPRGWPPWLAAGLVSRAWVRRSGQDQSQGRGKRVLEPRGSFGCGGTKKIKACKGQSDRRRDLESGCPGCQMCQLNGEREKVQFAGPVRMPLINWGNAIVGCGIDETLIQAVPSMCKSQA